MTATRSRIRLGLGWVGTDDFDLDTLGGQAFDDPWGQAFAGDPPMLPEDLVDEWWWREMEQGALAHVVGPTLSDDDVYINPATGLAILPGSAAGIDTGGNPGGCEPADDFLHSGTDLHFGTETSFDDSQWSNDSSSSFGFDDWS